MRVLRNTFCGLAGLALVLAAAPAAADQVILDDLIVDGSICAGFDCVNGESFGFDTLRLKENNLRIKFQDTSTSASFPSNDWQITINDSSNGGQNKFSIDDIDGSRTPLTIEAGAPSHSLYVDDGGRIGLGTSTPVADLHVKSGNTPTLRLEQDGSSGFSAQTWDVAGNEANFFIRDATNGSRLPFRIRPGAPSDAIDIKDNGEVRLVGRTGAAGQADLNIKGANNQDHIIGLGAGASLSDNVDGFLFGYNGAASVGQGFIGTRPTSGTGQIVFAVKNVTEMTLTETGLDVTDEVRVGGVPLIVPDYVFADDYQLLPMGELADFIAEHKHLPGVPSEKEIKAGGLSLGGFQMKLLEKVEELTLYTLQQEETIRELSERLEALEGTEQ